jgi:acyl-CoA reductase-like NAD-dependent aldehyde dehydrogenase
MKPTTTVSSKITPSNEPAQKSSFDAYNPWSGEISFTVNAMGIGGVENAVRAAATAFRGLDI